MDVESSPAGSASLSLSACPDACNACSLAYGSFSTECNRKIDGSLDRGDGSATSGGERPGLAGPVPRACMLAKSSPSKSGARAGVNSGEVTVSRRATLECIASSPSSSSSEYEEAGLDLPLGFLATAGLDLPPCGVAGDLAARGRRWRRTPSGPVLASPKDWSNDRRGTRLPWIKFRNSELVMYMMRACSGPLTLAVKSGM